MWAFVITLRRSSVRTQLLKIFSSETTWPLETKLWWNGPWVISFQNCVRQSRPPTNMVAVTKMKRGDEIQKIFISETTGLIGTKLCLVLWWTPFKIVSGNPDIHLTWPLLLKTEKVDGILIVFFLNYWANWIQALPKIIKWSFIGLSPKHWLCVLYIIFHFKHIFFINKLNGLDSRQ